MNNVAVHDILESDFDAPLTDEALEELGFKHIDTEMGDDYYWEYVFINDLDYYFLISECESEKEDNYTVYFGYAGNFKYTTVGGVKLLIEALKGDE